MRRIYTTTPASERFWRHVDKSGSCWLWLAGRSPDGYGKFKAEQRKTVRAHRFAYELAHGPIPDDMLVCHNCPDGDNPLCVNPAHLFLGSTIDNVRDRVTKGRSATGDASGPRRYPERMARGEQNSQAKLTEADVREIRRLYAAGLAKQQALAERYGVSQVKISQIVLRKCWQHI